MISGWYDSFLPWQLKDFAALQGADRPRQLMIGPWSHTQEGLTAAGVREGLAWLRGHLLGDPRLIDTGPIPGNRSNIARHPCSGTGQHDDLRLVLAYRPHGGLADRGRRDGEQLRWQLDPYLRGRTLADPGLPDWTQDQRGAADAPVTVVGAEHTGETRSAHPWRRHRTR
jgi:hypothetical protein